MAVGERGLRSGSLEEGASWQDMARGGGKGSEQREGIIGSWEKEGVALRKGSFRDINLGESQEKAQ